MIKTSTEPLRALVKWYYLLLHRRAKIIVEIIIFKFNAYLDTILPNHRSNLNIEFWTKIQISQTCWVGRVYDAEESGGNEEQQVHSM